MTTWHPPIPSEAVYSKEVAELGAGLRLLWYLYNGVQRDGTVEFSIKKAGIALNTPYETVRTWWQVLRPMQIVAIEADLGKKGFILRFDDEWLDWHVLERNYSDRATAPVETSVNGSSIEFERATQPGEDIQRSVNGSSTVGQRATVTVEDTAYKVLHDDQESKRESENHDNAVGSLSHKNGAGPKPKQRDALALAIAQVCRINPDYASRRQKDSLNEAYLSLKGRGATPEDIPVRVEWWRQEDWRAGKEPGRPITPIELVEVWDLVEEPERGPKANAPPTDNRPPLPPFQPQSRGPTDRTKFANAVSEVFGKKRNDTS